MARVLRMPEVAANATEAVLAEWQVAEAASFSAGDSIATVETEKALVDVEADSDGALLKTLVVAGAQVEVGAPIAVLGDPGEQADDVDALLADLGVAAPEPALAGRVGRSEERATAVPVGGRVGRSEERATDVSRPAEQISIHPGLASSAGATRSANGGRVFASPLARKLAKEAGIPVEEIDGTGPRNRILRRDVEKAVADRTTPVVEEGALAPVSKPPAETDQVPHTRLRRAVATRLQESKRDAPHFYVRATIRADRLVALREEVNDGAETRISLNDLVVKAVAAAHLAVPEMNVVWGPDAVTRHRRVDVAVAVATDRGLVTPVVRDVASLTVTALAARTRDLADRARAGRLKQDELEGGTISVTNLGMYGVEEFAAIINPPHAAVLAVGAVTEKPVVDDGALAVGKLLRVTLSVDHRPVDGVIAAQWMAAFTELMEHPVRILAS